MIQSLFEALEREPIDSPVRAACVRALEGSVPRPGFVPLLIDRLRRSNTQATRVCAIMLLGKLGDEAAPAIPILVAIVKEDLVCTDPAANGEDIAGEATRALKLIAAVRGPDSPILEALAIALRSQRPGARVAAIDGLRAAGPLAVPFLPELIAIVRKSLARDAYSMEGEEVAALQLLERIGPGTPSAAEAVKVLTEALDSRLRADAVAALRRFGPQAAPALPRLRTLRDSLDRELNGAGTSAIKAIEGDDEPPQTR